MSYGARYLIAGLALAALSVGACRRNDTSEYSSTATADSTQTAAGTVGSGSLNGTASSTTPPLTDANVFAMLDAANESDSASGAVAEKKASAKAVKDYGRMMVHDHHAARVKCDGLAKKLNVLPASASDMPGADAAKTQLDSLNGMPKGAAWDKQYMDWAVQAHQDVLNKLDMIQNGTQNEQIKALIDSLRPTVQKHLDKAQEIRGKLT